LGQRRGGHSRPDAGRRGRGRGPPTGQRRLNRRPPSRPCHRAPTAHPPRDHDDHCLAATGDGALLGVQFNSVLLGPSIVSGITQAGLYAMLAIALVLTYQVSRTVAFVHGGLAIIGAMGLWWLTYDSLNFTGPRPLLPKMVGLLIVVVVGAAGGAAYGALV